MNEHVEFRMARCDRYFLWGMTLMVCGTLGLVSVLVSWAVGGTTFKDSFYGDHALIAGLGAFLLGVAMVHRSRRMSPG